jgi:hypothetical protein
VTQHESTVANADLWSRYFQEQWSPWLSPFASAEVAAGTAARVAGFLTFVAAGPIAWLYNANVPNVSNISNISNIADHRPVAPVAARSELDSVKESAA